jgi:mannose-1-phosphate guanylyltransferase
MGIMNFVPVILAGGLGKRLYPLSTVLNPKQFLVLDSSGLTQLQVTAQRLIPLCGGIENLFVVTLNDYLPLVEQQLPDLPLDNIILEPESRGTTPAVALAVLRISQRQTGATFGFFPCDHRINDTALFHNTVLKGYEFLKTHDQLLIFGSKPEFASSEFGYIELGLAFPESDFYAVQCFLEKPSLLQAQEFIEQGNYLWNLGMFFGTTKAFTTAFQEAQNTCYSRLIDCTEPLDLYQDLQNSSFDKDILALSESTICLTEDFLWLDLGTFSALSAQAS